MFLFYFSFLGINYLDFLSLILFLSFFFLLPFLHLLFFVFWEYFPKIVLYITDSIFLNYLQYKLSLSYNVFGFHEVFLSWFSLFSQQHPLVSNWKINRFPILSYIITILEESFSSCSFYFIAKFNLTPYPG